MATSRGRGALRIVLAIAGVALVMCGGWALATAVSAANDPQQTHAHSVPIGLLGSGAIVLGGLMLAIYVATRRPA